MYLHDQLKDENARLQALLSDKEALLDQTRQQYADLEARYADLKIARTISVTDQDIADTKQRLQRLVREVDRCIALLNE
jgi:ABC-type transporter Mla subunit MlaD